MPLATTRTHRHAAFAAFAISAFCLPTGSAAMTLTIPESAIVSLANAPTLHSVDGAIDTSGRAFLTLDLEFPNDCYAAAGAVVDTTYGPREDAGIVAVLGQLVPPDGCPDIFQPVRLTVRAMLPAGTAHVVLLARPAANDVVRIVRIDGPPTTAPMAEVVEEIAPPDGRIAPEIDAPVVQALPDGGYLLSGRLLLDPACAGDALQVRVYEVPDAHGAPTSDAILLTAPADCATTSPDAIAEFSIRVATPQPPAGRRVLVMNSVAALPLSLSR